MGLSNKKDVDRKRMQRYVKILEHRKVVEGTCFFCPNPIEVLHHKDENHSNNRDSNLLSLCKLCHEKVEHGIDSTDDFDAITKSEISWSPDLMARSGLKKLTNKYHDKNRVKTYLGDSLSGVYESPSHEIRINLLTESIKAGKVLAQFGFKKVGGFL